MEFTKKEFEAFRKDMESALDLVSKKYNVNIHAGSLSYDQTKFTIKVDCTKNDIGDVDKINFENNCEWFGFKKSDYRRKFNDRGKTFRLIGFKPGARKNSCIIEDDTGTQYVCSPMVVKNLMK